MRAGRLLSLLTLTRPPSLFATTALTMSCAIPSNPDISGIGVRVAIYIQNLLSFLPAFYALWDGKVEEHELKAVGTQSTTILVTAFAILISTIVQARTFGLSSFHTSVILNLSWMNNTNTFIYFLLYVHYKSDRDRGNEQIAPQWSAWVHHWHKAFRPHVGNSPKPNNQLGVYILS
jgi:hypothetical protein